MEKHSKIYCSLSIVSVLLPIVLFLFCLIYFPTVSCGLDIKKMDGFTQNAFNVTLEASNSLASLAILLFSGVWGFFLIKKEKINTKGLQVFPLIGGSLALFFSYVCYRKALSQYTEMFKAKTVDLYSPFVQFWPNWQMVFFSLGFLILGFSLYDLYQRR